MASNDCEPRVYVACLACYNAKKLHGHWLDADDGLSDAVSEAFELNEEGFAPCGGEEFLCHDLEGFPEGTGEIGVSEAEELGAALREHGEILGLVMAHHRCDVAEALRYLEEGYSIWYRLSDWAQDYYDQTGDLANIPVGILGHIDWEGVADEMMMGGGFWHLEHGGSVYVFWSR